MINRNFTNQDQSKLYQFGVINLLGKKLRNALLVALATIAMTSVLSATIINPSVDFSNVEGYVSGAGPIVVTFDVYFESEDEEYADFIQFVAPTGVILQQNMPSPSPYAGCGSGAGDELFANNGENGVGWGDPANPEGGSGCGPFQDFTTHSFGVTVIPQLGFTGPIEIVATIFGDGFPDGEISVVPVTVVIPQLCTPEILGDAYVCPDEFTTYTVDTEPGGIYTWSVVSGGQVVGSNVGSSINVQWGSLPGGAHQIRVNEINTDAGCSGIGSLFVVIEGSVNMACNDTVQVSLNEECWAQITPDVVLEGGQYEEDSYIVDMWDEDENIVPNNIVTSIHAGQLLTARVTHGCTGVSCWGVIAVEDKVPAPLFCSSDTIDCNASTNPFVIGFPVPPGTFITSTGNNTYNAFNLDACGGITTLEYFDETEDLGCSSEFGGIIYRTWIATDASENESTCLDTIYTRRITIDEVTCPPSYDDMDLPSIECGSSYPTLPNGHPHPDFTGYPGGVECENIQFFYTDIKFDICGSAFKVLRHWVVLDWCTGQEIACDQIIKIVDNERPVVTCPPDDIETGTDPWSCTGTLELPLPNVIFECSDWTYTVAYLLADENGDPPVDGQYITDSNVTYNPFNNLYTITNLPLGRTWVRYIITDACGNSSPCFTEILVIDDEAPSPVCETNTIVSLGSDGFAAVYATAINDNSIDNCGVDFVEIRRETSLCGIPEDTQFGEKIKVCCADLETGVVTVRLRVHDFAGNSSECVVDVTVEDNLNPIITCPPNVVIDCTQDYLDTSITGEATATDNCEVTITSVDNGSVDNCGIGTIFRIWTATDAGGRTSSCVQRIDVINTDPFDEDDIIWPAAETQVEGCTEAAADPNITGIPFITNDACADIIISYDDQVFYEAANACVKVVRTWSVADWCTYQVGDPLITFDQAIKIVNTVAPTFISGCENQTVETLSENCVAFVELRAEAFDECSPSELIEYSYEIDLDDDGTVDNTGFGNDASGTYQNGTHRITFFAENTCGNVGQCSFEFTVRDIKAPTPLCLAGVSTVLLEDDMSITIWASDFNHKSFDNCTEDEDLLFSFSQDVNDTGMTFDCADLPDGASAEIPLEVWVTDEDGNQDFCSVVMTIIDNKNLCPDVPGLTSMIAGRVSSRSQEAFPDVEVNLVEPVSGGMLEIGETGEVGDYEFNNLELYQNYNVSPYNNEDPINGVSTLDLVLIQKYILGLGDLEAPYDLIAADINNSGSVSAADLVQLRKLILGYYSEFPDNTSWRFLSSQHEFADSTEPWVFPEMIEINNLILNELDANFTAIKIGDVNGSVSMSNATSSVVRNEASIYLEADDSAFDRGEEIELSLNFRNAFDVIGCQFTINFDPSVLAFASFRAGLMNIDQSNLGLEQIEEGKLSLSWSDIESLRVNSDDVVISLVFNSKQKGILSETLSMTSDITRSEAYDSDLKTYDLDFEFRSKIDSNIDFETVRLLQNTPNPFESNTTIGFELTESAQVNISIFDLSGKLLYQTTGSFEKGRNSIVIEDSMLNASGVLYYQLQTNDISLTKKMIKLD